MSDNTSFRDQYLDLVEKALTASLYDESAWVVVSTEDNWHQLSLSGPKGFRKNLKRKVSNWLIEKLKKRNLYLVEPRKYEEKTRENGRDWPMFGYSMIGMKRMRNIRWIFQQVIEEGIPGDFLEAGAWRGGTCIYFRALIKAYDLIDRTVWVADSFEGMPMPKNSKDGSDHSTESYLSVSLEQVKANFSRFGLLDDQVQFLKGWFSESLPDAPVDRLAILRLDGDLYHSTIDVLNTMYDKVSIGGYVIIDDYYSWPGCRRAVRDFFENRGGLPDCHDIDTDAVWFRKPA